MSPSDQIGSPAKDITQTKSNDKNTQKQRQIGPRQINK